MTQHKSTVAKTPDEDPRKCGTTMNGKNCTSSHDNWRDYKANYCPECGEEL